MGRSIGQDSRGRDERESPENRSPDPQDTRAQSEPTTRLREVIDQAAQGRPSMSEFIDRLENAGIGAMPSLQKSGRLNGMSYEVAGVRYRGSDLGRSYTALGLLKKGVRYIPTEDDPRLQELAIRAREHPTRAFERSLDLRERSVRVREYDGLGASERVAMREVGRFRTILVKDFIATLYRGDRDRWSLDLKKLSAQNLLEIRSIVIATHDRSHQTHTQSLDVLALTKKGKGLLRRFDSHTREAAQAVYSGFVKPREIGHDAAIYRMYQAEAAHIEGQGGRVKRIILDFELKKKAYAPLARARAVSLEEYHRKQAQVAEEHGLKVVDGKIRLPDLRIEYETANGEMARVDLELATEHYRGDHMSAKDRAGFKIYADSGSFPPGGSYGRSAVFGDHEIEIFSF